MPTPPTRPPLPRPLPPPARPAPLPPLPPPGARTWAPVLLLPLLLPVAGAAPGAWALAVEAPEAAPVGLPFLVRACVEGAPPGSGVEVRLLLPPGARAWHGADARPAPPHRYGPAFPVGPDGAGCVDVAVQHPGPPEARARLEARARPAGADAARARGAATLALAAMDAAPRPAEGPVAVPRVAGLRVPALEGVAHVPVTPGEPAPRLRVAEVRGPPWPGVVLRNEGDAAAHLAGWHLGDARLPPVDLAPGASVFVGPRAPPDAGLHAEMALRAPRGEVALRQAGLEAHRVDVPRLGPGEAADAAGRAFRLGRTQVAPAPMRVEGTLVAYVTPDAGAGPVLDLLASAEREVLVEGYTLTSPDVAAALLAAHARGVRVRVLLEGGPVGGVPPAQKEIAGVLAREGVEVAYLRAAEDFPARYASLHAKTLVVDRRAALVATENLHASSYPAVAGAPGTRGFGLVVHDEALARIIAGVFEADAAPWPDVRPARRAPPEAPPPVPRAGATPGETLRLEGSWEVTPLLSPEAGVGPVVALLGEARASVDVAMLFLEPTFGEAPSPLVEALVDAARRGARVRVLLDGHLDAARNAEALARLQEAAAREGLPLEARLSAPGRTLHAKLALVDGRWAMVGSMNGGEASATRNREVGLLVDASPVAAWFGRAFEEDWAWRERVGEEAGAPARREVGAAAGPGAEVAALVAAGVLIRRPSRGGRPRRA